MIISDFDASTGAIGTRVSALIRFEEGKASASRLYFESPAIDAERLLHRPDPFVVAGTALAIVYGERRVRVEGVLCPILREGLRLASARHSAWRGDPLRIEIESSEGVEPGSPPSLPHPALFLSGGVDALALLRANRSDFPSGHPGSFRTGIFLFGFNTFDFVDGHPDEQRRAAAHRYLRRLTALSRHARLDLVLVETNLRHLTTFEALRNRLWGLMMAAAGMAVDSMVTDLWLASDGLPFHVQVDQMALVNQLSNSRLRLHIGQPSWTRLEKTRLVADWKPTWSVLRSCFWHELPEGGSVNCGRCEKCLRTMLALVALDRLPDVETFDADVVEPELVRSLAGSVTEESIDYYPPLSTLLGRRGHDGLALEVERLIRTASERHPHGQGGLWSSVRRRLGL